MNQREVVVVSGVRTAIGDYGGSLKAYHQQACCITHSFVIHPLIIGGAAP